MGQEIPPSEVGQRIEELLAGLTEHAEPEVAAAAEELAERLMDMYGAGLERIVTLLAGTEALRTLVGDDQVSGLLVLHDLHPDDTATRAATALESVRPYLGSHAGDVELLGVTEEAGGPVVRLALRGSCDGCPSSTVTVRTAIETALAAACPEVVRVDVDGLTPDVPVTDHHELPLLQIGSGPPPEPASWVVLEPPPLRPGEHVLLDVSGHAVLVASPAGVRDSSESFGTAIVAYADGCADCGATLAEASLIGDALSCGNCPARYNLRRAGQPLTASGGHHLQPLPLVERAGGWRLALPSRPPRSPVGAPAGAG
jgi:Fe-S cluster biogenesis protein NfuA